MKINKDFYLLSNLFSDSSKKSLVAKYVNLKRVCSTVQTKLASLL